MEEKERFEWDKLEEGYEWIRDTEPGNQPLYYDLETVANLLNQQDKRIKELEEELDDAKRDYIPKLEFGLQRANKGREVCKVNNEIVQYKKRIAELQKQLEKKEKDNQFFKKMYLSEKQKNDNYHTEKYGLDKPVEELRKIKLTPKEKEIYYKGFDNCERQFATHIAELEQQLKNCIKPKFKIGQEVWVNDWTGQLRIGRIYEVQTNSVLYDQQLLITYLVDFYGNYEDDDQENDYYEEKDVFATKEEAEQKLAELQKQLAESEDCNNMLNKCLTEKDIEIETQKEENAELQKQLEEKEKEIRRLDNEKGMLLNNSMKLLKEKDDKLKSQPAEIVEKIKEFVDGNAYYYEEEQYAKHIIKYLDDILKEYQK